MLYNTCTLYTVIPQKKAYLIIITLSLKMIISSVLKNENPHESYCLLSKNAITKSARTFDYIIGEVITLFGAAGIVKV